MNFKSDFLYACPSFISGIARLLDLFGTFDEYNRSPNGQIADARALRSDFGVIGSDIYFSIQNEKSIQANLPKQIPLFSKR